MPAKTQKAETTAIKRALRAAGINARATHGSGSAKDWILINIGSGDQWGPHDRYRTGKPECSSNCYRCRMLRNMGVQARDIAMALSGRAYDSRRLEDGQIVILHQDHYDEKRACNVRIDHPKWIPPDGTLADISQGRMELVPEPKGGELPKENTTADLKSALHG